MSSTHLEVDEDLVNNPEHYGGDACMRHMERVGWGRGACLTSIERYLWRLGKKGRALQDVGKAKWYARRLVDHGFYGQMLTVKESDALRRAKDVGLKCLDADDAVKAEVNAAIDELFAFLDQGIQLGQHLTPQQVLEIAERDYKSRIGDLKCQLEAIRHHLEQVDDQTARDALKAAQKALVEHARSQA